MFKTKYLIFLFIFSPLVSFSQFGGNTFKEAKEKLSLVEGKITNQEASKIIDALYAEKVLNSKGRDMFRAFVLERKMPQLVKIDDEKKTKELKPPKCSFR